MNEDLLRDIRNLPNTRSINTAPVPNELAKILFLPSPALTLNSAEAIR